MTSCYRTETPATTITPTIEGTWLGGAYELDRDVYVPFPKILHFSADGTYSERWIDKEKADTFQWAFQKDSLHIDTFHFPMDEIKIGAEQLNWGRRYTRSYQRIQPRQLDGLDTTKIDLLLQKTDWENKTEKLRFQADGGLRVMNKTQEGYATYCYKVESFESYFLLVKYGNQTDCHAPCQFLEQIISIDRKTLKVLRWEKDRFQEVSYKASANKKSDFSMPVEFQRCDQYKLLNNPQNRYYNKGPRYPGGLYSINNLFKDKYKPLRNARRQTGLIRIRFVVNCAGEAGLFETLELDNNYQEKKFDQRISDQILEISKTLQSWIPATNREGKNIDHFKYLTFKIKDGKIIEIFF
ncbi:MAG: hypothetical protein DHS20C18_45120 [Saprospiraceae bacterium]|nr:MAG: hypothetical protein DHS20C18_45120 [Saprospiraceae bacterium]